MDFNCNVCVCVRVRHCAFSVTYYIRHHKYANVCVYAKHVRIPNSIHHKMCVRVIECDLRLAPRNAIVCRKVLFAFAFASIYSMVCAFYVFFSFPFMAHKIKFRNDLKEIYECNECLWLSICVTLARGGGHQHPSICCWWIFRFVYCPAIRYLCISYVSCRIIAIKKKKKQNISAGPPLHLTK